MCATATTCTTCLAGFEINAGTTICDECSSGFFKGNSYGASMTCTGKSTFGINTFEESQNNKYQNMLKTVNVFNFKKFKSIDF